MRVPFLYDSGEIQLDLPAGARVYESAFPPAPREEGGAVLDAVRQPLAAPPLRQALSRRRPGEVVVVVSDITRPIPYARFLPELLAEIEAAGVKREEILVLIACGMHRPSTAAERETMFGREVVAGYGVADHQAHDAACLARVPGRSWSGQSIRLNRRFVEAGFRIVTGLVEPHFMAGFSGGRKAVCPGLSSLDTVQQFHGYAMLADPLASNGVLDGNPCHRESLSVAEAVGVDFTLNVVLNRARQVVGAFAGDLRAAHLAACDLVRRCACPAVTSAADVVVTSSGGYPLDATFYQCVKGMVTCLPAVERGGAMVSFGGCREGIGGAEYARFMADYAGRWREFLEHIRRPGVFVRDQWEFQMQARALEKVGQEHLHFVTSGLTDAQLSTLSVTGVRAGGEGTGRAVQALLDRLAARGKTVAALPEGPYCAPLGV